MDFSSPIFRNIPGFPKFPVREVRERWNDIIQVGFINSDSDLYSADVDRGVETRTFNITDELGTIQHVFSGAVIKTIK